MALCECGCGGQASPGKRFIQGHNFRGKIPWNKGLTKETNDTLKNMSKKLKEFFQTDEGLEARQNLSKTKKEFFATEEGQKWLDENWRGENSPTKRPEVREKLSKSFMGRIPWNKDLTKETDMRVEKLSMSLTGRKLSEEHIQNIKKNHPHLRGKDHPFFGKHHTVDTKQKISATSIGKHYSPETEFKKGDHKGCEWKKGHIPWNKGLTTETDERLARIGEKVTISRTGRKQSVETIEKRMKGKKGKPHSEEHTRNLLRALFTSPNYSEVDLGIFVEEIIPGEYVYTGHGDVIIGGLCPDFFNINGKKKIIELFGEPFHDPSNTYMDSIGWKSQEWGRKAVFGQFGYDTLVIWSEELKDKELLKEKILEFHNRKEIELKEEEK